MGIIVFAYCSVFSRLGFEVGDLLEVKCEKNKLIITKAVIENESP